MVLPISCINACNPEQAAADAHDLGRLKDVRGQRHNYSLEIFAGLAAACAEAFKPAATVKSITDVCLSFLSPEPRKEVQVQLDWAKDVKDWKEMRPLVEEKYKGKPISNAVEILGSVLAVLYLSGGNPKDTLLYCVNFGRDTDCKAYLAGGIAGALRGVEEVPAEWIKIVEDEVITNPWTVSNRTAREAAEGLYKAARKTADDLKDVLGSFEKLI